MQGKTEVQIAKVLKKGASGATLSRSAVSHFEKNERVRTITVSTLDRYAGALECKVVYGLVPLEGNSVKDVCNPQEKPQA